MNLLPQEDTTIYAKDEMGTKSELILGIPWNKRSYELAISFSKYMRRQGNSLLTKIKMLAIINSIFDQLDLISPVIITFEVLYSQLCKSQLSWEEEM